MLIHIFTYMVNEFINVILYFHRPLRPSLRHKQMKDDADVEDAAYDIRPDLAPAEDILVGSLSVSIFLVPIHSDGLSHTY